MVVHSKRSLFELCIYHKDQNKKKHLRLFEQDPPFSPKEGPRPRINVSVLISLKNSGLKYKMLFLCVSYSRWKNTLSHFASKKKCESATFGLLFPKTLKRKRNRIKTLFLHLDGNQRVNQRNLVTIRR